MKTNAWIWTPESISEKNAFVRFLNAFSAGAARKLLISADSRYWIWLNGEFLGSGPVRSWVNHWKYDEYDLTGLLREGGNTLAVMVNHWGTGNFQYLPADPGLWVGLADAKGKTAPLLNGWKCSPSRAHASAVPRISVQQGFEEQFDARLDEPWQEPGFDACAWVDAIPIAPPHPSLEPSGIPLLTRERVLPQRVVKAERIAAPSQTWTIDVRRLILPDDLSSQLLLVRGFLVTRIWSERAQEAVFMRPHHHSGEMKLNGKIIPGLLSGMESTLTPQSVRLKAGWNTLLVSYPDASTAHLGYLHIAQFVLAVRARFTLKWSAAGIEGGPAWAFLGPFEFTENQDRGMRAHIDFPRVSVAKATAPEATAQAFETLWADAGRKIDFPRLPYFQPLPKECVLSNCDAFALACLDQFTGPAVIESAEALLSDNAEWTVIHPAEKSEDIRVLLDYGREVVGPHDFELDAPEGTVVDFFNFEFIQPDGRENFAEGMNNSLRYICKGGRQRYRALQRRGFQYSYIIFRNFNEPVRLRSVAVEFATYPQRHAGHFASSDALLNRIWEVGAHTLRCCAEDTYTDCPTYEQTHWVGDSRNEALVDWVVNGDPRLWFRCLEQIGQSLELPFNTITASQTPSSWPNLLPAWSFLWMRSCREYLLWTGDAEGAARLLPWVEKNVEGVEAHVNKDGLFEFQGWNMFDWAAMDTPSSGVITHLNCFAVLALKDCAGAGPVAQKTKNCRPLHPPGAPDRRRRQSPPLEREKAGIYRLHPLGRHPQPGLQPANGHRRAHLGRGHGRAGQALPRNRAPAAPGFCQSGQSVLRIFPAGSPQRRAPRKSLPRHHPQGLGLHGRTRGHDLLGTLEPASWAADPQPLPRLVRRTDVLPFEHRARHRAAQARFCRSAHRPAVGRPRVRPGRNADAVRVDRGFRPSCREKSGSRMPPAQRRAAEKINKQSPQLPKTMPIRKAFLMQVNADAAEEYQRRHNPIWRELEATLKEHGASNYSIFLDKERHQLFGYVEIESEERWTSIAQTDICKKWWHHMADIMPTNPDESPVSEELQEVFYLS